MRPRETERDSQRAHPNDSTSPSRPRRVRLAERCGKPGLSKNGRCGKPGRKTVSHRRWAVVAPPSFCPLRHQAKKALFMGCGASTVSPEPHNPTADASALKSGSSKKGRTRRASVEQMTTPTSRSGSSKAGSGSSKKGRVRRSSVEQVRPLPPRTHSFALAGLASALDRWATNTTARGSPVLLWSFRSCGSTCLLTAATQTRMSSHLRLRCGCSRGVLPPGLIDTRADAQAWRLSRPP